MKLTTTTGAGRSGPWRTAWPPRGIWLTGSIIWAVMAGAIAYAMLSYPRGWGAMSHAADLALFYAGGALLAFSPALWIARRFSRSPLRWPLFAILLAVFTAGLTATLIGLQYRHYFSQWHGAPFSTRWMYEQFFTFAGSTYQYVVVGSRLYGLPGLAALVAMSWWATQKAD